MKATLYEISGDVLALDALLDEMGGDITDEREAAIIDEWLHETRDNLQGKVDSYIALIRENEARGTALEDERKRIYNLEMAHKNRASRLKERLLYFLREMGLDKLETERFALRRCQNGGPLPVVLLVEPSLVPSAFCRQIWQPDFEKIREALEVGNGTPWLQKYARIGERGEHLRIR